MSFSDAGLDALSEYRSGADDGCTDVLNVTDVEEALVFSYSPGEIFYVTTFLPIVLVLGVLDNSAFIYVVFRVPRMQNSTNCYLLNLAVADIAFLVIGIGEKIWRYRGSPIQGDDNPLGQLGCVWVYLVIDMMYFASLCFVTLVSIDRYLAVCRPRQRYVHVKQKAAILTIVSWLTSVSLSSALIPSNTGLTQVCLVFSDQDKEFFATWPSRWGICTPTRPWMKEYANGMQTIPFFYALIINVIMFVLIVRGLNRSIERLQAHSTGEADTQLRDRIARMLVVNGVAFFVCLAPFEIMSFADMIASVLGSDYHLSGAAHTGLLYLSRSLSYINCVINPVIYTMMSHRYRLAFKQAFHIGTPSSLDAPSTTTTKFAGSTTNEYLRVPLDTRV